MGPVGRHYFCDLYGCSAERLDDAAFVVRTLRRAAELAGTTFLKEVTHHFHPEGVTALGLLAESHIAVHTWPETRYAAADIFSCGGDTHPRRACEFLARAFEAETCSIRRVTRGTGRRAGAVDRAASRPSQR